MDFTTSISDNGSSDMLVNVNGSDDPFYRYKMHLVSIKHIAKNGGMTIVENAEQVARDIYRELPDLKSCFAKAIGVSVRVQIKDGTLAIPGQYVREDLQKVLNQYIQNNVLCCKCGIPETVMWKKRKRKCQACGNISDL